MLSAASLRHSTRHSCQMVWLLRLLLLLLLMLLWLRLMVVLLLMLLVVMLLLHLVVMLSLWMVLGRSGVLLLLLLYGRSYGDAVVVLVVEPLVVGEGPVAGQRVGAFETGGCGVVEVVLDLLGYGPVVPGRRFALEMSLLLLRLSQVQLRFGLLVAGILRSHFFFFWLVCTFVNLVVTGHSERSRWIVEVTTASSFGSHLGTGVP